MDQTNDRAGVAAMNRYSGRNSVVNAGTYVAPVVPLAIMASIYRYPPYQVSWLEVGLLWLTGLGISYGMIMIHELGHAVAARLAGIGVAEITIGHWRRLIFFSIGSTKVTIRAAPASGYVTPKPTPLLYSVPRMLVFVLGGVLAEGTFATWFGLLPSPDTLTSFRETLFAYAQIDIVWSGVWHVFFNLRPNEFWIGGEKLANDGLLLVRLWTRRHERKSELQLSQDFEEVKTLCATKQYPAARQKTAELVTRYPENLRLLYFLGSLHGQCGDSAQGERVWRDLVDRSANDVTMLVQTLDALSCLPLFHDRKDLLGEADAWTKKAIQLAPHAITLRGTRGSILVELGRFDDGIAMLRDVYKRTEEPHDRIYCGVYLSKAYTARGDPAEADCWMKKAIAINPDHTLVKRAQQATQSVEQGAGS